MMRTVLQHHIEEEQAAFQLGRLAQDHIFYLRIGQCYASLDQMPKFTSLIGNTSLLVFAFKVH